VLILVESSFTKKFVERILGKMSISAKIEVKSRPGVRPCDHRLGRIVKLYSTSPRESGKYCKIVIIVDGDGREVKHIQQAVLEHLEESGQSVIRVVVLDYEIEEWVCDSLGVKYGQYRMPKEELRHYLRSKKGKEYRPRDLPKYADLVDPKKLKEINRSFRELVGMIYNENE